MNKKSVTKFIFIGIILAGAGFFTLKFLNLEILGIALIALGLGLAIYPLAEGLDNFLDDD